jgi:plasmid replication initiation protein
MRDQRVTACRDCRGPAYPGKRSRGLCENCRSYHRKGGTLDFFPRRLHSAAELVAAADRLKAASPTRTWDNIAWELGVTYRAIGMARQRLANARGA